MALQTEATDISPAAIVSMRNQILAALDMVGNAMAACPEQVWLQRMWAVKDGPADASAFWYISYHALFWTDLYLDGTLEGFAPPQPFNLDELSADFIVPAPPYTKEQLATYLQHTRTKCISKINALTPVTASVQSGFRWLPCSYFEVQLYSMRHIQEHAAQLNMFLGQTNNLEARWVRSSLP